MPPVLGKLGAANRTEAVTRARELGLILTIRATLPGALSWTRRTQQGRSENDLYIPNGP